MPENKQKFTEKHAELWKFIKFSFAGAGSSIVEIIVQLLCTSVIFKSLLTVTLNVPALNFIGIESKGYLFSYLISITVGYTIAFILNRKVTFHADSNPAVSITLYIIMVIFTIFAGAWLGSVLSGWGMGLVDKGWNQTIVDFICKLIQMAIPTLWTYPLNRFVIHRKRKPKGENAETENTTEA
ncbi:MAG: GtrA family protein [Clostridiales bacterium]|nr:GtrA family protein [Clostridiales bacterium]